MAAAYSVQVPFIQYNINQNYWRHPTARRNIAFTSKSSNSVKRARREQRIDNILYSPLMILKDSSYDVDDTNNDRADTEKNETDKDEENDDFDFSSPIAWDIYYKKNSADRLEWHDSIDLDQIVDLYMPSDIPTTCLMIGCGNSKFPQVILSNKKKQLCNITLLDTSQVCLDQTYNDIQQFLEEMYTLDAETETGISIVKQQQQRISYVRGDATKLSSYFCEDDIKKTSSDDTTTSTLNCSYYDTIIDKGLFDAILCGEGWDTSLKLLLKEASKVLQPKTGRYLMISYKLSAPTKDFFQEIGNEVGLSWQFNLTGSNERVMVSVAQKTEI